MLVKMNNNSLRSILNCLQNIFYSTLFSEPRSRWLHMASSFCLLNLCPPHPYLFFFFHTLDFWRKPDELKENSFSSGYIGFLGVL